MPSPIPIMNAKGIYVLRTPWAANPTVTYTCTEMRAFQSVAASGVDVYKTYYEPKQLSRDAYNTDRDNGEYLLTLTSDTLAPIFVPSSFLVKFPDSNTVPYRHVVLSASCGILPDSMDLTFAKEQLAAVLADIIGRPPIVYVNTAPFAEVVTVDEHITLERTRTAAVVNRTTDRARVVELDRTLALLREQLREAHRIIQANNLIPS